MASNDGWEDVPSDSKVATSDSGWEDVQKLESPTEDNGSLIKQGIDAFTEFSRSIPLSDRMQQAAFIGKGLKAVEQGMTGGDIPYVISKVASGATDGILEDVANNPIAGEVERGADAVKRMITGEASKKKQFFPKPNTEAGKTIGDQLGLAATVATLFVPVAEESVAERITKAATDKVASSRANLANATEKIVEFDKKVRNTLFEARVNAGHEFRDSVKALQTKFPETVVDASSAVKGLGIEVGEGGELVGNNPKLINDIKGVLNKSGNKTLQRILMNPDEASKLTLDESQNIIQSIKKIPSLSQKLSQGKFAQYSDTDIPILQFIEDLRDSQLSAFPEFEKTLGAYRQTMQKFRILKPYFKETNLVSNVMSDFKGNPILQSYVREILPDSILKEMDGVRKDAKIGYALRSVGKLVAKTAVGGAVAGEAFNHFH